jgi:CHAT domain-containing protein/tetratricopeptide (TPR) repeat protein
MERGRLVVLRRTGTRTFRSRIAAAALLLLCATGISNTQSPVNGPDAIRALIVDGRYDEAEAAAARLLAEVRSRHDGDSISTAEAGDLLSEARWRNGSWTAESIAFARSNVAIRESVLGANHPSLAASVTNLGRLLTAAGRSTEATAEFQRAQALLAAAPWSDPIDSSDVLDELAAALSQSGRHIEAKERIAESVALKRASLEPDDVRIAGSLETQAQISLRLGEYAQARALLETVLPLRAHVQPQHPLRAGALAIEEDLLWFEGDIRGARDVGQRALNLAERSLRPGHPTIAVLCRKLASSLAALGEFESAKTMRSRAVDIVQEVFGDQSLVVAGYLNDLANSYVLQGDYSSSRSLYERALAIYVKNGGSVDGTATFTHNLGEVSSRLGDYSSASKYEQSAIDLWKQGFGGEHPFVATAISALADVRVAQHRDSAAIILYARALTLRERAFGPDHVEVARTLASLAATQARAGQSAIADRLSARAVRIWQQSGMASTTDFAAALSLRGDVLVATGDYRAANEVYTHARDLLTQLLGPNHRTVAETRVRVGHSLSLLDDKAAAFSEALEGERLAREHLRTTLRYLPEREALLYSSTRTSGLDLALSILLSATRPPGAVDAVLDAVIKARAVVFDEMAERRRAAVSEVDPALTPLWRAFLATRQRLANLSVAGPIDRPELYRVIMDEAVTQKDLAERALAEKSASFRERSGRSNTGLPDVRAAMPPGSALVAYVRYARLPTAAKGLSQGVPSYVALVLPADGSAPSAVALGTADRLDRSVDLWRKRLSARAIAAPGGVTEDDLLAAGIALRQFAWDPVAMHLGGARRVFIVPDGTLNLVNFTALPTSASRYLVEGPLTIHYLSAERDLLNDLPNVGYGSGLLAIGGAAFAEPTPARTVTSVTARATTTGCSSLQGARFDALPGTRLEAGEIAQLWNASHAGTATVLTDQAASEHGFKSQAPGRRVLHLATHGFFLDGSCPTAGMTSRAVGGLVGPRLAAPRSVEQNPLLVAGLALAGANRRSGSGPADEDGILTAEEVAGMPLDGVEWAVLSACDTGLGEIRPGEGVFGLRRAFQIAGARTVIMSLWSVGDEPTRRWMRTLYEYRLLQHLDTADAVRQASLTVLRERRVKGLSTDPFYWGAFVAAGDWR